MFVALFKTDVKQNDDMVIFFLRSFRKRRFKKNAVSGRWFLDSKCHFSVFPIPRFMEWDYLSDCAIS